MSNQFVYNLDRLEYFELIIMGDVPKSLLEKSYHVGAFPHCRFCNYVLLRVYILSQLLLQKEQFLLKLSNMAVVLGKKNS